MSARFLTDPSELAVAWPQIAALLEPVVTDAAHGEFALDDLLELAAEGRIVIGVHGDPIELAMAFEFRHYPRLTALNILAIGGKDMRSAAVYWDGFKGWAKSAGANCIEASCSPSMARLLRRYGFKDIYRTIRSEL